MTQVWHRRKSVSLLDAVGFSTGADDFEREDPLCNGGHETGDLQTSQLWFKQKRSFSYSLGIPHQCSRWLGCPFHIPWNIHCTSEDASEPWSPHLSGYTCWSWPEVVKGNGISKRCAQLGLTTMGRWKSRRWTNATELYSLIKWLKCHLLYILYNNKIENIPNTLLICSFNAFISYVLIYT